jgi:hypothetical protein
LHNYKPEYLTGIIAGCKMQTNDLLELRQLLQERSTPIKLFKAVPNLNKFSLELEIILIKS